MTISTSSFIKFLGPVAAGGTVDIPVTALPSNAQVIQDAYGFAVASVLPELQAMPNMGSGTPLYDLCVYNCGASYIINWAPDQPRMDYFKKMREGLGINTFVGGVVSSTSDETDSTTLATPDWVKGASIADLQYLKDPYGRFYLGMMQRMGSLWGMS